MAKTSSITKEMIVEAALAVARQEGFGALSARQVSRVLGCSTQPIYWVYHNMDDLKQDVMQRMIAWLNAGIKGYRKTGKPLLDYGLGYLHMAYSEPVLFKAIYVDNVLQLHTPHMLPPPTLLEVLQQGAPQAGLDTSALQATATRLWLLAHGLACLIVAGIWVYNEDAIATLLMQAAEE